MTGESSLEDFPALAGALTDGFSLREVVKGEQMRYPLLDENSESEMFPQDNCYCPICGKEFTDAGRLGFLLSVGVDQDVHLERDQFGITLDLNYHGGHEPFEYLNLGIVDCLNDSSFVLDFCSVKCMKEGFNGLMEDFQKRFRKRFGYDLE